MGLDDLFKLEKLKVEAYGTVGREKDGGPIATFTAMFNPETLTKNYAIQYGQEQGLGSEGKQQSFARSYPADMGLTLVLDGSGVGEMGIVNLLSAQQTVAQRVEDFVAMAFARNSEKHEPNFLVLRWGQALSFPCRLSSLAIRYTSFNRDGSPLRAELELKLISDESVEDLSKKQGGLKSPDVTHSRIVRAGDSLPLLVKEVYGSSAHYLWVAKANGLDGFRRLEPGRTLVFPPLPSTRAGG